MLAIAPLEHHHADARIAARPRAPRPGALAVTGMRYLGGVQIHVPAGYSPDRPAALLVMLHGAGGDARQSLGLLRAYAEVLNIIVAAPKSTSATWDMIGDGFGPDVAKLDCGIGEVFDTYAIDPHKIAIGGFSDGASYALSLGLANGDLFRRVFAFAPGFEAAPARHGTPAVFVAHGIADGVLPIDRTSRRLVPRLRATGVPVEYVEFDGPHVVPNDVLGSALASWLA